MGKLTDHALDKRNFYIYDEINSRISKLYVRHSHFWRTTSNEPINIYISSGGGSLIDAITIINEIQVAQEEGIVVNTTNIGEACSSAAFILSHGSRRVCRPNCHVMLHPCSYGLPEDYAENQAKTHKFIKGLTERYNQMLTDVCKQKNYTKFMKEIANGLWLDAEGAVKYGVVDVIE